MKWIISIVCFITLSSCSLAPRYQRPAVIVPSTYKESGIWLTAHPNSATLERGPWWRLYNDPVLNALEEQVINANQNLRAALARYEQACTELRVAEAALYPTLLGIVNGFRQKTSKNIANKPNVPLYSDILLGVNLTYELDIWGRVRNTVLAAKNTARASAADLAFINLSLHAELASIYFALRGNDASQRVLDETVTVYKKALDLTRRRYQGGAAPIADVYEAKNQFETAKTLAADMRLQRAQREHAIAILIGLPPSEFVLKPQKSKMIPMVIRPDLPSTLLERRPDIAEAELRVKAANANIGVARAAFFPFFNLSASVGLESAKIINLFKGPSLVWSLGPTTASALLNNGSMPFITQTLFDGGKINALADHARAVYFETVANYRQTVLNAYQDVEDSLIALRELDRENQTQQAASLAAKRTLNQAIYRYKGGLTTYLDVIVSQNIALQAELALIDIRARRQVASIRLIKALGGGIEHAVPSTPGV